MSKNIIHIVGTGTIGEPLIGLLSTHKEAFGIDEVTFLKNTPRGEDRPKVLQLTKRGAHLVAKPESIKDFVNLGHEVAYTEEEALKQATVVIDCTPSGIGNKNKETLYNKYSDRIKGFVAQGSEFGFGKMYAQGINDSALDPNTDQFLQIASCNTHNLSVLLQTLGANNNRVEIDEGRFLCLRRANDISQDTAFIPAPQLGSHSDPKFGTHHARDAHCLFQTLGYNLDIFSSACLIPTQYMHAIHFSIRLPFNITLDEVMSRFRANRRVAISLKKTANSVFSFGREHGHYGRILSQTVISLPTLAIRNNNEVIGYCLTPQDGNSIMSSIAAALWYLDPNNLNERLDILRPYLFQEV